MDPATRKSRIKKVIAEMYPVKTWLSIDEACSFMNMGSSTFLAMALDNNLTVSMLGSKKYYKVKELNAVLEDHIIIRHVK
ncbi:hypothetical protein QWZ08_25035 [Ferruginibacter paludis]|uniref:hypothetical protein n=1 Tax=Ferruginibacter paludis TaxID=1310417 RepID=UPI0025B5DE60|nr:hypothetical protein [Ferruginibacter paludis]MDN3658933.1 hypothetical protein [Ferruginibacter paludis]